MTPRKNTEPTFEEMLHRLEAIVADLDRGDVPLEDALARNCGEKLAKAELTLKKLAKDVEGNLKLFDMDQDE
jgi:exodeoxyribonuclease VII small subunit